MLLNRMKKFSQAWFTLYSVTKRGLLNLVPKLGFTSSCSEYTYSLFSLLYHEVVSFPL